ARGWWAWWEGGMAGVTVVIGGEGGPLRLDPAVQHEIQGLDHDQPVADVRTMESYIGSSISRLRFGTLLMEAFAVISLTLAIVGIYGVMAHSISQRTQEIGIRLALGARPAAILSLIVGQGLVLAAIGVIVGLAAAFGLTRLMTSLLYGVSATDPATFAAIALLLTVAALVSCYLPARRAVKVDPMAALRRE